MNINMKYIASLLAALLLLEAGNTDARSRLNSPAPPQDTPVLIKNAHVFPVSEGDFENGWVAFDDGKITFAGTEDEFDRDTTGWHVIDAEGKRLYPGVIALNTRVGLVEIDRIRATRDYSETGTFNPNVRSIVAYNTDSDIIPTLRANGVLLSQVTPSGGKIAGTSSVAMMDGWNWEDAAYEMDNGMHLNWPSRFNTPGSWSSPENWDIRDIEDDLDEIYDFFAEAYSYHQNPAPEQKNLRFEAMSKLFDGNKTLFIRARDAKAVKEAIDLGKKYNLEIVLTGLRDADQVLNLVAENDIPVIIDRTHRNPSRAHEDIDKKYKLPAKLEEKGITFGYSRHNSWRIRNYPFYAGSAVAHGLPEDAGLRSLTLYPAKILGIDDRTGTIEEGKDANLVISEGDIMDMKSSRISHAFIKGRNTDLQHHQEELFEIYMEKYDLPLKEKN